MEVATMAKFPLTSGDGSIVSKVLGSDEEDDDESAEETNTSQGVTTWKSVSNRGQTLREKAVTAVEWAADRLSEPENQYRAGIVLSVGALVTASGLTTSALIALALVFFLENMRA